MAPSSQKASERPISFLLQDDFKGTLESVALSIRPEDLSRVDPSRATPTQTLGGAWVDNFGPGLSTIQISGHTGWRGDGGSKDGVQQFIDLKRIAYNQYHANRAAAVKAGVSPDKVSLIFADTLDHMVRSVLPLQFTLKRSRSRPLLMMYQINMTVLGPASARTLSVVSAGVDNGFLSPDIGGLGIASLLDSVNRIQQLTQGIRGFIQAELIGPVQAFLGAANSVFRSVVSTVRDIGSLLTAPVGQLIGFARDIAQTGRNAFYALGAIINLPAAVINAYAMVAREFQNAFCVLSNCFRGTRRYQDYSDLYGASNCSSTSGGSPQSPLRGVNPFALIAAPSGPVFNVSRTAQAAMGQGGAIDPVLAPPPPGQIGVILNDVGTGVIAV